MYKDIVIYKITVIGTNVQSSVTLITLLENLLENKLHNFAFEFFNAWFFFNVLNMEEKNIKYEIQWKLESE